MSIFDLTFNGTVLEEHSPEQVKTDLGRFLNIDDPTLLETLFSGETIILRSSLDRKTAAEYFSEISELGGKVELVRLKKGASISTELARLEQTEGGSARVFRLSTQDMLQDKNRDKLRGASTAAENSEADDAKAAQQVLAVVRTELNRLQVRLHTIKAEAHKESEKLEQTIAHFKHIGQEEREKIETSIAYCTEHHQTTSSEFENSAAACEEKSREKRVELETQSKLAAQQAKTETDRLHGLIIEAEDAERTVMEELARARGDIEERAEKEIQDLQVQIKRVRSKADSELSQREEQSLENGENWAKKMSALRQEQDEIQCHAQRSIENFDLQQELTNESLAKDLAQFAQEREEFQQRSDAEISELRKARNAVMQKEADVVASAEHADEKMRLRSKKDLQRLHAVKLNLQRRETEALNRTVTAQVEEKFEEKPLDVTS